MADPVVRVVIGVAAAGAAVGFALVAWRAERRRALRVPLSLSGIDGRVVLFSDAGCARCDQARRALETIGKPYEEIAYDEQPGLVTAAGVEGVPLIVVRRPDGSEAGRMAGKVTPRRLRRLLAAAGL